MNMMAKLQNMIGFGKVTGAGVDNLPYSIQQVTYDGKEANVFVLFPYGMHGNIPADVLTALLAVEGDSANRVAIGGFSKDRPTMGAGENCIYHPPTGAIIHFKEDGSINLTTGDGDFNVISITNMTGNVNIVGDVAIEGDLAVDGNITCTGNATITGVVTGGSFTTAGAITGASVTAGGVSLTGHKHTQANDSAGNSQATTSVGAG